MNNNNASYPRARVSAEQGDSHTKELIADSVHDIIITAFPKLYPNLCHAYAVVGSNLASIVLGKNYRPVAGLAIVDAGNGHFLGLINNASFSSAVGGNYHCWIHSCDAHPVDVELVDFSFRNNKVYAEAHGIQWAKRDQDFLWGPERELNVGGNPIPLPKSYDEGKGWFCETPEGSQWMNSEVSANADVYVKLTALALRYFERFHSERIDAPPPLLEPVAQRFGHQSP